MPKPRAFCLEKKKTLFYVRVNFLDNPDEHRVTVTVSYFAAGKTAATTFTATSLLLDTQ